MATLLSILTGLVNGFVDLAMLPWTIWQWFHMDVLKERMVALTLAGKSPEFLYMMLSLVLLLVLLGLLSRRFLKATVLTLESFNRTIGQLSAWFVLLMMLQQVLIIIMGQVFRGNELLFSPFGLQLSNAELQWLSGQLKFYNAILITFASAYTFIEGGHVRVDLVYGNLGYRAQRLIDLLGAIFFMLPTTILLWWFAWPLATNSIFAQRPMNIFSDKASWRGVRLETSGTAEFTWVWAFKVLILVFAALLFIQAVAFLLRNLWALLARDEEIESHPADPLDAGPPEPEPDIHLGKPLEAGQVERSMSQPPPGSASAQLASVRSAESARRRDRTGAPKRANPTGGLAVPSLAPAGSRHHPTGDR
ncbi:MAG: TRAP transporter small permease subunit [Granulosicoccus sp.]|nr:TRAP transporter small permease subunit [Granulosicoccus sp.]